MRRIRISSTPEKYKNEIVAFVKRGLNDLSISRTTFDWGIPVPGDPKHVMYVWVDALTNYITATGYPDAKAATAKFWPASAHVIGKDITRFHAIYWPAFLMSAKLPVPKQIVVHGFLFSRGEKMSKSVGNVVAPADLVRELRRRSSCAISSCARCRSARTAITAMKPSSARINADLANDLGNLAQRSLSMIAKNCDGKVPACGALTRCGQGNPGIAPMRCWRSAGRSMRTYAINRALDAIWKVVADANRYFAGAGALGVEEDRSGADGNGALCDGGSLAHRRHSDPALYAAIGGEAARSSGGASDARLSRTCRSGWYRAWRCRRRQPIFPRYVEEGEAPAKS